jgi:putative hydroxymethylpyrimidine transport system substrate-binding protein
VPITTFGSLISEPTAAMIWLGKSGIDDVSDLEGKSIGISGLPSERALLENVLQREGLTPDDVEITLSDYDMVPDLVSGRVDAILGAANVEGAELEARGLNPVVTPLSDFGVPSYEEFVLIIRSDRLAKDPNMVRAFMTAVARGTAAAIEDPKAAASVMERSVGADPDRSRKVNEALVEATLPLLSRDGAMDPDQAESLASWMEEEGMVEEAPSADELLTNDYLPPAS